MTVQHEPTYRPHLAEWTGDDGWRHAELTGRTTVSCSCGLDAIVPNANVQHVVEEHRALAGA